MGRNIENVFTDKDDQNIMVIKVSDINRTMLVELNKKDNGEVDYTNYIADDGGVSDDDGDMFKEIYDKYGVGEAFLDNHTRLEGKAPIRDELKTYVLITDEFNWKGSKIEITTEDFSIDLEKHMGEDWYDRGWGEKFYLIMFQEDSEGNVKYINEFTYDGSGDITDHSMTYLNPDGSMILFPVNDKMDTYESLLINNLLSNLDV